MVVVHLLSPPVMVVRSLSLIHSLLFLVPLFHTVSNDLLFLSVGKRKSYELLDENSVLCSQRKSYELLNENS